MLSEIDFIVEGGTSRSGFLFDKMVTSLITDCDADYRRITVSTKELIFGDY